MVTASKIRKDILNALSQHVIPQLEGQRVAQFLAEPPFEDNQIPFTIEQEKPIPDKKEDDLQLFCRWKKENLASIRGIHIGIIYQGCSEIRIGVNKKEYKKIQNQTGSAPPGIIRVRANAPFVECFPPDVAGMSYGIPPELAPTTQLHELNLFLDKTFCSVSIVKRLSGDISVTHKLHIMDPYFLILGEVYLEELRSQNIRTAQNILHVMAVRLLRYFKKSIPVIQHISPIISHMPNTNQYSANDVKIVSKVVDFIQIDISRDLNCKILAKYAGISPQHLNTVFKSVLGTTPAQYIHVIRMQTASSILLDYTDAIYEIANYVGFTNAESFSTAFRKYFGHSPREFRSNHLSQQKLYK